MLVHISNGDELQAAMNAMRDRRPPSTVSIFAQSAETILAFAPEALPHGKIRSLRDILFHSHLAGDLREFVEQVNAALSVGSPRPGG